MRIWFFGVALFLAILTGGTSAGAQQAGASGAPAAAPATQATLSADPNAAQAPSGLPRAAPPPRTLRAYWHVFAAFAFAWGLLFGYALLLGRRFAGLETQIRRLEGTGS